MKWSAWKRVKPKASISLSKFSIVNEHLFKPTYINDIADDSREKSLARKRENLRVKW